MAAFSEQAVRERLMERFIDQDQINISLFRPIKETSAAGGTIQVGVELLGPQEFYFYPFKRRLTQEIRYNPQSFGEDKVEYADYILIFMEDVDIQPGDYFTSVTPGSGTYGNWLAEDGYALLLEDSGILELEGSDAPYSIGRLADGRYEVNFVSPRRWDRGQAGILFRG